MNFLVCDLSAVANPELITANDRLMSYEDVNGDANWNSSVHAPISWHSYAAAMNGRIVSVPKDNWREQIAWADTVLALWNYDPGIAMQIIQDIKKQGKLVIGAFHENGDTLQMHARNVSWLIDFKNCANACDAILTYPRHKIYQHFYRTLSITTEFLEWPQPYYTLKRKDYIIASELRQGIFIGPRKKNHEIERRNWIYNIAMAKDLIGKPFGLYPEIFNKITTINDTDFSNESLKAELETLLDGCYVEVIKPLKYDDYLRTIATHQITINMDASDTQGQVDADSMFVGVPLYQPSGFDFRTDFGDLYYSCIQSGQTPEQATETIMTRMCTFENTRKLITNWYARANAKPITL
ncbi:hypothetical protein EOD41_13215 [Mucilaginibacter limnophilus]|uniref:Glycosyltransferase family 1 protein n=1 Tax=Mucilaginibacter limnophilus TaxID=1932778 RepID=A0A3S2UKJ9_9SPHI|nr:hypothetical protein [Mucilaginibacter limnophilus]RVU00431.1 hypothetical protein EOD41_13215 [Mucilaginibacter limnophilus]